MIKYIVIPGSTAGFFSMFRGTVGAFSHYEQHGFVPYVMWNDTIYDDLSVYDEMGDNVWDWYFENPEPVPGDSVQPGQHAILPREYQTRLTMNKMINKYVTVKDDIMETVDNMVEACGPNYLGVHVRLTDKNNCVAHGEPETGRPLPVARYIEHAKKYLENRPETRIFLSTDDYSVVECFQEHFPKRVSIQKDCIRSTGDVSVHHGSKTQGYLKGKQVLIDCLMLSRSAHLIKGISNVALCAMFFNNTLTCENLNSIYNGDTREDFVVHPH